MRGATITVTASDHDSKAVQSTEHVHGDIRLRVPHRSCSLGRILDVEFSITTNRCVNDGLWGKEAADAGH